MGDWVMFMFGLIAGYVVFMTVVGNFGWPKSWRKRRKTSPAEQSAECTVEGFIRTAAPQPPPGARWQIEAEVQHSTSPPSHFCYLYLLHFDKSQPSQQYVTGWRQSISDDPLSHPAPGRELKDRIVGEMEDAILKALYPKSKERRKWTL